MNPIVSVVVTAYNHENFVEQALDSILGQQTDFDYEVLLGEDDSEDRTRAITKGYADRYPDQIRLTLQNRKNVISVHGLETGRYNFMNLLSQSKAKYIAMCDGDDYWTSTNKLQKQIDVLEANPDISMCFHDVQCLTDDGAFTVFPGLGEEKRYSTVDLFNQWFIPTSSMLFRNQVKFPHWFSEVLSGDIPLHFLLSEIGDLLYLPDSLAVYRKHPKGISNRHIGYTKAIGMSRLYHYLDMHFEGKYREQVNRAIEHEIDFHVVRNELDDASGGRFSTLVSELETIKNSKAYRLALFLQKLKRKVSVN